MIAPSEITVVVLAAGLSRRHREGDKLLRPLAGKPLAAHIADTLGTLEFSGRMAVVAHGSSELADLFRKRNFTLAFNPDPARGLGYSLALGMRQAIECGAPEAVLICLADMPAVSPEILGRLMRSLDTTSAVVCSVGDQISPPALIHRRHFPALARLDGDTGARAYLRTIPDLARIAVAPEDLQDFDTPADFADNA